MGRGLQGRLLALIRAQGRQARQRLLGSHRGHDGRQSLELLPVARHESRTVPPRDAGVHGIRASQPPLRGQDGRLLRKDLIERDPDLSRESMDGPAEGDRALRVVLLARANAPAISTRRSVGECTGQGLRCSCSSSAWLSADPSSAGLSALRCTLASTVNMSAHRLMPSSNSCDLRSFGHVERIVSAREAYASHDPARDCRPAWTKALSTTSSLTGSRSATGFPCCVTTYSARSCRIFRRISAVRALSSLTPMMAMTA